LLKRVPRLAVINATGADTFYQLVERQGLRWNGGKVDKDKIEAYYRRMDAEGAKASTLASAIEINRPVNLAKALRALERCGGVVREVSDQETLDAKAKVGAGGFGCEPASAAGVAGARKLRQEGVIAADERVVCVLTGHGLKDPTATVSYHTADKKQFEAALGTRGVRQATFANRAVPVANDLDEIIRAIEVHA
jgi:threonine synthase